MKKIIVIVAILFSAVAGQAQQMNTPAYNKEEYDGLRAKAKHDRVAGIILVSGGGGLIAGGLIAAIIGGTENATTDQYGDVEYHSDDNLVRTGLIIAGIGAVAEFVSIPFFVKSHSYRKQAREVRFHANSSSYAVPVSGFRSVYQPQLGLGVTISL
jgi:hypothetical protein